MKTLHSFFVLLVTTAVLGAGPASAQAPAAPKGAAASASAAANDCDARWKAYRSSQACYAPFQNVNGTLKPGAQSTCGPALRDPSAQCGIPAAQ